MREKKKRRLLSTTRLAGLALFTKTIMSVLGICIGSHSVYVAVCSGDASNVEVLCDELGCRSVPSCVAFRQGCVTDSSSLCEVLVGQSAKQQQAKNPSNTFVDIRGILLDIDSETVHVPALNKDIKVQELAVHLFRHIFNQVKQQTIAKGNPIKDCYLCLPANMPDANLIVLKERLADAARAGGLCVRGFCAENIAPMVALSLDKLKQPPSIVAVVDVGWTGASVSLFSVLRGLFFQIFSTSVGTISAESFNDMCVNFCLKDFKRRFKIDCSDNKRALTRLSLQCEQGMKTLINSQETSVVVDSLCEGVDYAGKISRTRFEDLCSSSAMTLRNLFKTSLDSAQLDATSINYVILTGMQCTLIWHVSQIYCYVKCCVY